MTTMLRTDLLTNTPSASRVPREESLAPSPRQWLAPPRTLPRDLLEREWEWAAAWGRWATERGR